MAFREPRQRLGPAQRGPLPLGVARRFAPGRQQIDALLGLALAAGFGRMHVDAVGAAVDLRGANFYELDQARLEAGGDREHTGGPPPDGDGGGGEENNLGRHGIIPFVVCDHMTSRGPPKRHRREKKLDPKAVTSKAACNLEHGLHWSDTGGEIAAQPSELEWTSASTYIAARSA